MDILENSGKAVRISRCPGACDLQTEHERYLTEKHFGKPGVRDRLAQGDQGLLYAHERRRQDRGRGGSAGARAWASFAAAASARNAYDVLEARIRELGMNPEDYWWYLELRKYGTAPARGLRHGLRAHDYVPYRHSPTSATCCPSPAPLRTRISDQNLKKQKGTLSRKRGRSLLDAWERFIAPAAPLSLRFRRGRGFPERPPPELWAISGGWWAVPDRLLPEARPPSPAFSITPP